MQCGLLIANMSEALQFQLFLPIYETANFNLCRSANKQGNRRNGTPLCWATAALSIGGFMAPQLGPNLPLNLAPTTTATSWNWNILIRKLCQLGLKLWLFQVGLSKSCSWAWLAAPTSAQPPAMTVVHHLVIPPHPLSSSLAGFQHLLHLLHAHTEGVNPK